MHPSWHRPQSHPCNLHPRFLPLECNQSVQIVTTTWRHVLPPLIRAKSELWHQVRWKVRFFFSFFNRQIVDGEPSMLGTPLALKFVCHSCKHFGTWLYLTVQNPLYQKSYLFCLHCFVSFVLLLFFVCLFVFVCLPYLFGVLPTTMFSCLQFGLNVGLVGVTYSAITLTYAVGTILTGPITDRLVRYCRSGNFHVKNNLREKFSCC